MIMYILYKYLPLVGLVINDHVSIVEVSPPGTITESTLLDKNTPNQSETPNFSNISSPGYGGSPNLSR